jgi:nifR3 family TIM-barrel protein
MLPAIDIFKERFGESRFFMAPMAGITDTVFRSLIREMGAQVVISELVSAEGLVRGGAKTLDLIRFDALERPVGIQIFGSDPQRMAEAAHIVEQEGADFVDINFGCPVRKVVCDGAGAAWLKEPARLGEMLFQVKKAIRIPLTIKIRTGWDDSGRNALQVVEEAAKAQVSWVAIHGRTRAQGYSGLADWEYIKQVAEKSPIPIIGNGDIVTASEAWDVLHRKCAHAVMIGRGALKNPWIFREILGHDVKRDLTQLIDRHFELAIEKKDSHRAYLTLKKFLGWYAAGYPYSSTFRSQIFQTKDVEELRKLALQYFSDLSQQKWELDRSPFLMGGHG